MLRQLKLIFTIFIFNFCYWQGMLAQQDFIFKGNSKLTGEFNNVTPTYGINGIKFTFHANGPVRCQPAYYNGKVYFGTVTGTFYAIDGKTGRQVWQFNTGASISSSPTISNGVVYFSSRNNHLYALNASTGKLIWKFMMKEELPYFNGWDYFLSSVNIVDQIIYVGSGDGNLYALNSKTADVIWKYDVGSRIRTTPAVTDKLVVFGALNGMVYAIQLDNGKEKWKFATDGASLDFESVGYDQTSVISSPAVNEKGVYVGGRDGNLYAINIETGKEMWRNSHDGSWVLAVSCDDNYVFASSGSSAFIRAVDINTGKEKWTSPTKDITYGNPILVKDVLYTQDYEGFVYALNKNTGKPFWAFPLGAYVGKSFSTPLVASGMIYCATDDGILYALEGKPNQSATEVNLKRYVYWSPMKSKYDWEWFKEGGAIAIRDYFKMAGYAVIDSVKLAEVMKAPISKTDRSVIVFSTNEVPSNVLEADSEQATIRQYLNKGGKVVFLGPNPLGIYYRANGDIDKLDYEALPEKILGVKLVDRESANLGSYIYSQPTESGKRKGLNFNWVGTSSINPDNSVDVLAANEYGYASCWLKNYGGREGTGLLQLWLSPQNISHYCLNQMLAVTENGIGW